MRELIEALIHNLWDVEQDYPHVYINHLYGNSQLAVIQSSQPLVSLMLANIHITRHAKGRIN